MTDTMSDPSHRFRMTHGGGTTESDTLTALVAALVGGDYADLPQTDEGNRQALTARWQQSASTANLVQAVVIAAATETGAFDVGSAGEDILTPLFADRARPVDSVDDWSQEVPLVLISTDYAPFTDRTPPTGNVRWINPHTERTYIETLSGLGVVDFEVLAPSRV